MNKNTVIEFKAESFRKLPNPYKEEGDSFPQMYTAICDVKNIPDKLLDWMETNPRKQNLNGKVGKKIQESLCTGKDFHLLNRGILISASETTFNNYDNTLKVVFNDPEVHGDVDGGHTLKVIMKNKDDLEFGKQYVKVEILTGVESIFEDLAEARNTSTQVKDESIANLKDYYNMIKEALSSESYADRINYMENDEGDIEIGDILAILNMFNIEAYPDMDSSPVTSYSSKKKCIDTYNNMYEKVDNSEMELDDNPYYKMSDIMPDIFKLYNEIECNMSAYYATKIPGGKYGSTTGVTTAKEGKYFKAKFSDIEIRHSTPKGFIYPILGSFRALIKEENNKYIWSMDPFKILKKVGPELVAATVDRSRQNGNNPNKTGKDITLWPTLYMRVMFEKMMSQK